MNEKKEISIMNKVILGFLLSVSVGVFAQTDGVSAPSAGFGSTSSMMGSGSAYSSSPSINAYGMAEAPGAYAIANRGRMDDDDDEGNIHHGSETTDPTHQLPIGDAVPFLLLLAVGYGVVAFCRRKEA